MVLSALIIALSLLLDRITGDPHTPLHPVALLGRFIGWWGRPSLFLPPLQRITGIFFWILTISLFSLPFLIFERLAPWYIFLLIGPFFLKITFAWRSLEDHVIEVTRALSVSVEKGREQAKMLVSRNTTSLDKEQVLSAAYESAAENLVDSIIAPLFYFGIGEVFGAGLAFAAGYRAINTMDAMLGYRDERIRLGWFPARMDDIFGYLPARIAGFMLLIYFALRGRAKVAYRSFLSDAKKRPGYNGGIPLALIAGGVGVIFEKPGVYRMGRSDHTLAADGGRVLQAVRGATLLFAFLLFFTLCLLRTITYM